MKAKLLPNRTVEEVRRYWKQINAPVYLRKNPSNPEMVTIGLMPDAKFYEANFFLFDSLDMTDLNRDAQKKKLLQAWTKTDVYDTSDVRSWHPVVVLENIWGKLL